jgi:predicted XRE-type DNA-binding protein
MSTLKEEFTDTDYRREYAESFANTIIATQIRLLRGAMTQAEFAELVGVRQSRISAMEDENYSAWSTKTLKKLAAARDVVFLGRFVSFGELLNWSRRMSKADLTVSSFADDSTFTDSAEPSEPIAAGTASEVNISTDGTKVVSFQRSLTENQAVRNLGNDVIEMEQAS